MCQFKEMCTVKYIIPVCWAICLIVSYNFGLLSAKSIPSENMAIKSKTNQKNLDTENSDERRILIRQSLTDKDVVKTFGLIKNLDNDNYFKELELFSKLSDQISSLNSSEIRSVIDDISALDEDSSYPVLKMLYAKWAESSPEEAIDYMNSKGSNTFEGAIVNEWSKNDPDKAFAWIKENIVKANSSSIYNYFKNIATTDLEEALKKVSELPRARSYAATKGIISNTKTVEEYENIVEMVDTSEKYKDHIFHVYYHWSQIDPAATLTRIKKSQNKEVLELKSQVENNFAQAFPVRYAEWQETQKQEVKNETK